MGVAGRLGADGMDAAAWETVIPSMESMALMRDLRNFDEADISTELARHVRDVIIDPERVARSRRCPYRFWSAYRTVLSLRWAKAPEKAFDYSIANIPALPGRTLALTDASASMTAPVSHRSKVRHFEIAALFTPAAAKRADTVDLCRSPRSGSRFGCVDRSRFSERSRSSRRSRSGPVPLVTGRSWAQRSRRRSAATVASWCSPRCRPMTRRRRCRAASRTRRFG